MRKSEQTSLFRNRLPILGQAPSIMKGYTVPRQDIEMDIRHQ